MCASGGVSVQAREAVEVVLAAQKLVGLGDDFSPLPPTFLVDGEKGAGVGGFHLVCCYVRVKQQTRQAQESVANGSESWSGKSFIGEGRGMDTIIT